MYLQFRCWFGLEDAGCYFGFEKLKWSLMYCVGASEVIVSGLGFEEYLHKIKKGYPLELAF